MTPDTRQIATPFRLRSRWSLEELQALTDRQLWTLRMWRHDETVAGRQKPNWHYDRRAANLGRATSRRRLALR